MNFEIRLNVEMDTAATDLNWTNYVFVLVSQTTCNRRRIRRRRRRRRMFIWSQIVHVVNVIMRIEEYIYI